MMNGQPAAMAGAILVGHQVQGEVEWRDADDDAGWKALDEAGPAGAAGDRVQRNHLTFGPACLFSGEGEGVHTARDLAAGEAQGLSRLGDDGLDELLPTSVHADRHLA